MGNLEEMRISYNKGYLDAKKEWLMLFISWIGKQDLKRYDAVGLVNFKNNYYE